MSVHAFNSKLQPITEVKNIDVYDVASFVNKYAVSLPSMRSIYLILILRGSFAMVVSATRKDDPDKKLVAIKLINMEHFDQLNLDRVTREVEYAFLLIVISFRIPSTNSSRINGLVKHKNIVEVHEVYQDGFECSLVME
jgi:serine/threonine protein kinase